MKYFPYDILAGRSECQSYNGLSSLEGFIYTSPLEYIDPGIFVTRSLPEELIHSRLTRSKPYSTSPAISRSFALKVRNLRVLPRTGQSFISPTHWNWRAYGGWEAFQANARVGAAWYDYDLEKHVGIRDWNSLRGGRILNLDENAVLFSIDPGEQNVFHFLYEALPRALLLKDVTNFEKHPLVFCYPPTKLQIEILNDYGISNPIIVLKDYDYYDFDHIVYVNYPEPSFASGFYLRALSNLSCKNFNISKIFISRRDSQSGHREIENRLQLESYLGNRGYTIILMSTHSFADQRSLFAGADHIVFEGGAAGSFLTYCKPGTKVLDLMMDSEYFGEYGLVPHYFLIACSRGLHYRCLVNEKNDSGGYQVNLNKLEFLGF